MRILFGAIAVSAVRQRSSSIARGWARRSLPTSVVRAAINGLFLCRAVQTVAEIAEAGHDELVIVEPAIDDGRVDVHVGMMPLDERHAFGSGYDADHAIAARTRSLQEIER